MVGKSPVDGEDTAPSARTVEGRWMTLNQAVSYTSRSASTLRRAVRDGVLPRNQPDGPGSILYFTPEVLDAYMRGERRDVDGQDEVVGVPNNENAPAAATVGG